MWPLKSLGRILDELAEILEYTLVVLVSSLMAGFSFEAFGGFASASSNAADQAAYVTVVTLARTAVEQGTATGTVSVPGATIGCSGGAVGLSAAGFTRSSPLGVSCGFADQVVGGTVQLTFRYAFGSLTLEAR